MMRRLTGFLKLWRPLLTKPIWQESTPEQKVVLIALLCMANHSENEWEWKGQPFMCQPGQMITSIDHIIEVCGKGISSKNVRTAIARFEKLGFLANESSSTGRLITIENWGDYQAPDDWGGKETGRRVADERQTGGGRVAPNKNVKNRKKSENEEKIKDILALAPSDMVPALEDFIEYRSTIKAPMTARALELLLKELNELSGESVENSIAIINQSIKNGWKGVFPLKNKPAGKSDAWDMFGSGEPIGGLERNEVMAAFLRGDF